MPWQVARYLVGNSSAGMMYVVELGPVLAEKKGDTVRTKTCQK